MGPKSWSRAVIKGRGPLVAVAGGGRVHVLACRDQCGGRGFWQGLWAVAVVVQWGCVGVRVRGSSSEVVHACRCQGVSSWEVVMGYVGAWGGPRRTGRASQLRI